MASLDSIIDSKSKEHFIKEIERKQQQIDDLKIAIDMNYKKLTDDGVLEGTMEGDMIIEEVESILNSIQQMDEECEETKTWIWIVK